MIKNLNGKGEKRKAKKLEGKHIALVAMGQSTKEEMRYDKTRGRV